MDSRADRASLADAIASWLRAAMERAGTARLVLGLSGGVDSAVVCGLCARAAGPQRVVAALLPAHSVAQDRADAELAARAFGVTPWLIDLAPAYDALIEAFPDEAAAAATAAGETQPEPDRQQLALANIKPRLRMTALYYLANRYNGLVVGTGNKTELSVGYFTKYGDGGVDLLPLGELDKTAVWHLAHELGVPEAIIGKPPSAGLWPGQTDEAEIGLTYAALDDALRAKAAGRDANIDHGTKERIDALAAASEHKRRLPAAFPLEAAIRR
jgi:NAD+ synthase